MVAHTLLRLVQVDRNFQDVGCRSLDAGELLTVRSRKASNIEVARIDIWNLRRRLKRFLHMLLSRASSTTLRTLSDARWRSVGLNISLGFFSTDP